MSSDVERVGKRLNSYDHRAPVPKVGSRWVWEINQPHACALIEVIGVWWNGEEWWIRTLSMTSPLARGWPTSLGMAPGEALNDLGRFAEAVTPVGSARGSWLAWGLNRPDTFGKGAQS